MLVAAGLQANTARRYIMATPAAQTIDLCAIGEWAPWQAAGRLCQGRTNMLFAKDFVASRAARNRAGSPTQ
ncbi:hypothetical protein DF3PA_130034 [Candidatus Defluviicoccus seviourii]|uniref:Uncharacterized protein n=2 Tax=root TaxID=1 RepID=A0A564WAP9_9PROT|nr:hypothetical protein DF3PB_70013 [uncultured Defluviicoccus sp.]VUX45536.1 hypothetical protein DF3PA_130034 [Candidatus Defluviicoccus seviourii]